MKTLLLKTRPVIVLNNTVPARECANTKYIWIAWWWLPKFETCSEV